MRKLLVFIVALATFSLIASAASAGKVMIAGARSSSEIRSTCDSAGGTFAEGGGFMGARMCAATRRLPRQLLSLSAGEEYASITQLSVSRDQGTAAPS
jgi:hypothetical protein